MKRSNGRSGSAIPMVLMFMTLMMVLGMGLLAASQYASKQSAAAIRSDKHYYAAESAAQLAARLFLDKLAGGGLLKIDDLDIPETVPDIDAYVDNMKSELREQINNTYADVKDRIENDVQELNGEAVRLGDELEFSCEIKADVKSGLIDGDGKTVYAAVVYLEDPNFVFTAHSGGRTVTVETGAAMTAEVNTVEKGPGIPPVETGAFYGDKTGGIYGDDSAYNKSQYDKYMTALSAALDAAETKAGSYTNFVPARSSGLYYETNGTTGIPLTGKSHVYASTSLKLGSGGTADNPIEYKDLEYLYISSGNLNIEGAVYCPNLKGVYVHSNITISKGGGINPMAVDSDGKITDKRIPKAGKTDFYCGSPLAINCDAEVNWCVFYANKVYIHYNDGCKLTSNSVFYPKTEFHLYKKASSDTSRVVPQFYLPKSVSGNLKIEKGIENVTGIFMTEGGNKMLGESWDDFNPRASLTGLLVGNYDQGSGKPVENAYYTPFKKEDLNLLMWEYGALKYLDDFGGSGSPVYEADVTSVTYKLSGLNLRETTGESSVGD